MLGFNGCRVFTEIFISGWFAEIVKHGLHCEKYKEIKNATYSREVCIMSGLAVFGFKMSSLLQFEKDKAVEPFIRHNLRKLYGVEKAQNVWT